MVENLSPYFYLLLGWVLLAYPFGYASENNFHALAIFLLVTMAISLIYLCWGSPGIKKDLGEPSNGYGWMPAFWKILKRLNNLPQGLPSELLMMGPTWVCVLEIIQNQFGPSNINLIDLGILHLLSIVIQKLGYLYCSC